MRSIDLTYSQKPYFYLDRMLYSCYFEETYLGTVNFRIVTFGEPGFYADFFTQWALY